MAEVKLIIKVENSDAINKLKQTQQATQKVYDTAEKGTKRTAGLIETEQRELDRLLKKRKQAYNVADLQMYNRLIDDSRKALEQMETTGVKATGGISGAGKSMVKSVGTWATAFAAVTFVLRGLVTAFKETEAGLKVVNYVGAITKQIFYDIAINGKLSAQGIELAIAAAKKAEELRVQQRKDIIAMSKEQAIYNELYFATAENQSNVQKKTIIEQAMLSHEVIVANRVKNLKEEIDVLTSQLAATPTKTKLIDALIAKAAELTTAESAGKLETKRLEQMLTAILKDEDRQRQESDKTTNDLRKDRHRQAVDEIITEEQRLQEETKNWEN